MTLRVSSGSEDVATEPTEWAADTTGGTAPAIEGAEIHSPRPARVPLDAGELSIRGAVAGASPVVHPWIEVRAEDGADRLAATMCQGDGTFLLDAFSWRPSLTLVVSGPAIEEATAHVSVPPEGGEVVVSAIPVRLRVRLPLLLSLDAPAKAALAAVGAAGIDAVVVRGDSSGRAWSPERVKFPIEAGRAAREAWIPDMEPLQVHWALRLKEDPFPLRLPVLGTAFVPAVQEYAPVSLALDEDSFLTGGIFTMEGEPLYGADVHYQQGGRWWAHRATHHHHYVVPTLDRDRPVTLLASYGRQFRSEPRVVVPDGKPVDLRIDVGSAVRFRLLDMGGEPVEAYAVATNNLGDRPQGPWWSTSSSTPVTAAPEGVLVTKWPSIPAGARLYVHGPGFDEFWVDVERKLAGGGRPHVLRVQPVRTGDLHLRVEGSAPEAVVVTLLEEDAPEGDRWRQPRRYRCNRQAGPGLWVLESIPYGSYRGRLRAGSSVQANFRVDVFAGRVEAVLALE